MANMARLGFVFLLVNTLTIALAGLGPNITNEANALLASTTTSNTATSVPASGAPSPTGTDSSSSAAPTAGGNNSSAVNQSGSPLLFFVALGFGVVFTNLWIIVGVKYCFRYNHRHRTRLAEAEADALEMGNQNRPHRRRREKKLMSMDEVNERFPLLKYKTWRATRESEGLPASGGVAMPLSRPATVSNVEGVIPPVSSEAEKSGLTTAEASAPSMIASHDGTKPEESTLSAEQRDSTPSSSFEKVEGAPEVMTAASSDQGSAAIKSAADQLPAGADDEIDEEADHVGTHPDVDTTTPGDTCAICIDNLEEDDDVRGLTCGHAFHASCLDPWLTSRRACCPLCKANFYVPKPRQEPESPVDSDELANVASRGTQFNPSPGRERGRGIQNRPLWRSRGLLPGGVTSPVFIAHDRHGFPVIRRVRRTATTVPEGANVVAPAPPVTGQVPPTSAPRSWRDRIGMPPRTRQTPAGASTGPS